MGLNKKFCLFSYITIFVFGMTFAGAVQAGGIGGFFKDLTEKLEEEGKELGQAVENASRSDSTKAKNELSSKTVSRMANPQERLAKSYEGALTLEDRICSKMVEPFELSSNFSNLFKSLEESVFSILRKGEFKLSKNDLRKEMRLKAKKMNWLPMDQEVSFGKMKYEDRLKNDTTLIERSRKGRVKRMYAKADALLAKALSYVSEDYPYKFNLVLINSEEINAEALPGGYLYVNTGVLDSGVGPLVISHEIAHVLKRHQTKELQARLIDSVETVKDIKKLLSKSSKGGDLKALFRPLVLAKQITHFSQQQELQADACGVRIVARENRAKAKGMVKTYTKLFANNQSGKNAGDNGGNQTSHPSYPERQRFMINVLAKQKS